MSKKKKTCKWCKKPLSEHCYSLTMDNETTVFCSARCRAEYLEIYQEAEKVIFT